MAISVDAIDAELRRRESAAGSSGGAPSVEDIDAELVRRGATTQPDNQGKQPDLASTLYHGAIEGGAMMVGGAAGGTIGALAGPVGSAAGAMGLGAAMYPLGKRAAEGIDQMRGITPPAPQGPIAEFGQGLAAEATGKVAGPILNAAGRGLARTGEALSGVPARDIGQLFKKPQQIIALGSKKNAGAAIGQAKLEAGVNPGVTADASSLTADKVNKAINIGQTGKAALDSVIAGDRTPENIGDALKYVSDEIKGRLSQRKDASELINIQNHLNTFLEQAAPKVQAARQEFAPIAQRNKFYSLFPKNKDGSYSKANLLYLNSLLGGAGYQSGGAQGAEKAIIGGIAARAPITTGIATAALGTAAKPFESDLVRKAALASFIDKFTTKDGTDAH